MTIFVKSVQQNEQNKGKKFFFYVSIFFTIKIDREF